MPYTLHPDCDETLTLTGLTAGGSALNSATVTYAIKDSSGVTVTGGSGTMTAAGSGGNYSATVESTVTTLLVPGGYYYCDHVVTSAPYNDARRIRVYVERRAES